MHIAEFTILAVKCAAQVATCIHIVEQPNLRTLLSGKTETSVLFKQVPISPLPAPGAWSFSPAPVFLCICSRTVWDLVRMYWTVLRWRGNAMLRRVVSLWFCRAATLCHYVQAPFFMLLSGAVSEHPENWFPRCSFKPATFFNVFGWCLLLQAMFRCALKPSVTWFLPAYLSFILPSFHVFELRFF